ncbi:MAG: exonuclease SbcCD subunit D [Lachnospiraceae bacterium]|nr:exonuclease SbcCD subunit D [Lachnospiraceae bacterium]
MKILHTSDWHLGMSHGSTSFLDDQRFFVDEICKIIGEYGVKTVLLAGDQYDRAVAGADAIALYDYAMSRICVELGVPVVSIAGNHDSAERLASCSDLLAKGGLHICGSLQKEPCIVSIEDTDFYLLPWMTMEKVRGIYPEHAKEIVDITSAYKVVCDKCRETFREGQRHIALSHAFVAGASVSSSDKTACMAESVGGASMVLASVYEGFDYVALGHIHGPQNITENIRYCGTPMPYSFGKEEKQEKSVTIIDTETMEKTIVPLKLKHDRVTITGTLDEVLNGDYSERVLDGYVKIEVTDAFLGMKAISDIELKFHNCLDLSGKSYDGEGSGVSMSLDDYRKLENNPVEIFKSFCRDALDGEATQHQIDMFNICLGKEGEDETN